LTSPERSASSRSTSDDPTWTRIRDDLRGRGLRWTPQRRRIVEVLDETRGHVTGSELVERCRERDPATTASTVYRTLDVLEELGYLHHSHSATGREEFHVLPAAEHAHLQCRVCGGSWELARDEAASLVAAVERSRGFRADLGHLTILGRCASCGGSGTDAPPPSPSTLRQPAP
jgi:Fur family transcriptional regulator, ferric uptake regulator